MAKMYMNRFAIEEDDQFEIHVKRCTYLYIDEEVMYNAAIEVILNAQQGSGFLVKCKNSKYISEIQNKI